MRLPLILLLGSALSAAPLSWVHAAPPPQQAAPDAGAHPATPTPPVAAPPKDKPTVEHDRADKPETEDGGFFRPEAVGSDGSVTVGGHAIDYHAVVGTLVVHAKGWDDAPQKQIGDKSDKPADDADHNPTAEAAMSYVAYFRKVRMLPVRPVMFLYNGGPGSSTVWLHMGAFGPRRVVTLDDQHSPAAPYQLVNNRQLAAGYDAIWCSSTRRARVLAVLPGQDKEKAFWGVDADAHAFAEFHRNVSRRSTAVGISPKYLFGESYGTTRYAGADQHAGE